MRQAVSEAERLAYWAPCRAPDLARAFGLNTRYRWSTGLERTSSPRRVGDSEVAARCLCRVDRQTEHLSLQCHPVPTLSVSTGHQWDCRLEQDRWIERARCVWTLAPRRVDGRTRLCVAIHRRIGSILGPKPRQSGRNDAARSPTREHRQPSSTSRRLVVLPGAAGQWGVGGCVDLLDGAVIHPCWRYVPCWEVDGPPPPR